MSYEQLEIPRKRNDWVNMLRGLAVDDFFLADIKDRSKIATSISNGFHKTTKYRFKTEKVNELTIRIIRVK